MAAVLAPEQLTAEAFLSEPEHERFELVDGERRERCMSNLSSHYAFELNAEIRAHIRRNNLGLGFQSDCALQIWPPSDNIRFPDGAFLAKDRVPPGVPGPGPLRVAPDLVFEVVSTHDHAIEVANKVKLYLEAGVRLVWVIYADIRSVHVYRQDGTGAVVGPAGALDGEDVLPGFRLPMAELFPETVAS
ncbi:MAG: Uma2 family endonuclease [Dehalococcoidia bacterium]